MPKPTDPKKHTHMFTDDIKFSQKALILHPSNNKFLVLQRSLNSKTHPGFWDFPGGNVLYGHSTKKSILDEIKEETGLLIQNELTPLLVNGEMKQEQNFYRIFVGYFGQADSENITLNIEHIDYKWVTKSEFMELETVDILKEMVRKSRLN
jgi:8-oxo-dGTP pyrophosphatase MutT (NUDIX family)